MLNISVDGWLVGRKAGNGSDVTVAFEDDKGIPPLCREETKDAYITEDKDNTDDTKQAGTGWNRSEQAGI